MFIFLRKCVCAGTSKENLDVSIEQSLFERHVQEEIFRIPCFFTVDCRVQSIHYKANKNNRA